MPKARAYHIFDVHLSPERGALATLARTLADAKVNLEGFMANRAGVQLLVADAKGAAKALDSAAYHYVSFPVEEALLAEKPGALAGLCENLAWEWTNIEGGFGMATGKNARVFLRARAEMPEGEAAPTSAPKPIPKR